MVESDIAGAGEAVHSIGILGGTFDPIHVGHLRPAMEVQQQFSLDEVRLVPCHRTSHREQPERSSALRSHLCQLAVRDLPGFVVDNRELARETISYTVDTLSEIRAEHPQSRLFFLMGADSFDYFQQWHRWQDIVEIAQLVILARPGTELSASALQLLDDYPGRIVLTQTTELRISSTAVRSLLFQGKDPRFLLPDTVRQYILQEQIYTEKS